jgi:hypothetical protein
VKILLVNPPLSAPTGPYPAITYLAGYLQTLGHRADLADASLDLLLRLFTPEGLHALSTHAAPHRSDALVARFLSRVDDYARTMPTAIACLQGRDVGALTRAASRGFFPPPLDAAAAWATSAYYASLGLTTPFDRADPTDEARFNATNLLADVCAVIRRAVDPDFHLDTYAEKLSDDAGTFDEFAARLTRPPHVIDAMIDAIAAELWQRHQPDVLGLSVPFPGNVCGALRIAAEFKRRSPGVRVVMGGGWVNTQLRQLSDPRIFDYVDFITLDDGERPLERVLDVVSGRSDTRALVRTFHRVDGRVVYTNAPHTDVAFSNTGTPTCGGLPLDRYLAVRPSLQSFQPIGGARWNKLTLAHGCYWKKCAFCDTGLDYIGRYDPASVDVTIARIRSLVAETGDRGFHFVDEAMPPAAMKALAERLIAEQIRITWWGNVRFDAALMPIAPLLAASGCIGLTGGLEVASERVLALIDKGITLEQAARVCRALSHAGIFTHAYLIYGFPTETAQETIDALEYVRQMFAAGYLRSAFWHLFELTMHSPIARDPERYGITIRPRATRPFSNMLLEYDEPGRIDHAQFGPGLRRAVDHWALGLRLADPVSSWFDFPVPAPQLAAGAVSGFAGE